MPDKNFPDASERQRAREAAVIVRKLEETPQDARALAERDAFLARGDAERETYARMVRALGAARKGLKNRDRRYVLALLGAALACLVLIWEPLRLRLLADYRTDRLPMPVTLASGDRAVLDASSALIDRTDEARRRVTLLAGAGYFDVATDGRPFTVQYGDVTVEALGTAFEVSQASGAVLVSVGEGQVEVRFDGSAVRLGAGERIRLAQNRPVATAAPEAVATETIAAWRSDRLTADGMTLGEVAAVIDRRLPGTVMVVGDALAETEISGGLDLARPADALRTLAATANASIISIRPLVTFVRP